MYLICKKGKGEELDLYLRHVWVADDISPRQSDPVELADLGSFHNHHWVVVA